MVKWDMINREGPWAGHRAKVVPNPHLNDHTPPHLSPLIFNKPKITTGTGSIKEFMIGCGSILAIGGALLAGYLIGTSEELSLN